MEQWLNHFFHCRFCIRHLHGDGHYSSGLFSRFVFSSNNRQSEPNDYSDTIWFNDVLLRRLGDVNGYWCYDLFVEQWFDNGCHHSIGNGYLYGYRYLRSWLCLGFGTDYHNG